MLFTGIMARVLYEFTTMEENWSIWLILSIPVISNNFLIQRLAEWQVLARKIFDNPLMKRVYTGIVDDLSAVELALKMRDSELRAVVGREKDSNQQVESAFKQAATKLIAF